MTSRLSGSVYPFPSDLSEDLDQEVTLQRAKLPKVLHRRERDCAWFVRPSNARRTPLSLRCSQTTSIGNLGKALPASLPFPLCQKVDTMDLVEHFHHPYVTVPLRSISMSSPVPKLKPLSSVVPTCLYHGSDTYPARLDFQSILPSPRSRSSSPFKALSLSCATLNTTIKHTQRPSKTFLPLPVTDTKVCQADGGLRTPCSVCALMSITTSPETTPRLSSETKVSIYLISWLANISHFRSMLCLHHH